MSKTHNNERTSKTNGEIFVTVTADSAISGLIIIHNSPVVPSVPASALSQVVIATLAQSDGSTKRANRTGITTRTLHQCLRPLSNQPEIDRKARIMISLIRAIVPFKLTVTSMEYPLVCEFVLRNELALRSAHDSIMTAHAKLKQTRDTIYTSQKRLVVVSFKWGHWEDFIYSPMITNMSSPKSKVLARKPTYSVVPKVIDLDKTLRDFGIASQVIPLRVDSHSRSKSHRVCQCGIYHSSVPHSPDTSNGILLSGRAETQIDSTNEAQKLSTLMLTMTRIELRQSPISKKLMEPSRTTTSILPARSPSLHQLQVAMPEYFYIIFFLFTYCFHFAIPFKLPISNLRLSTPSSIWNPLDSTNVTPSSIASNSCDCSLRSVSLLPLIYGHPGSHFVTTSLVCPTSYPSTVDEHLSTSTEFDSVHS